MPLIQTRGSSSISGYGGASVQASTPTYIEDVFSTYLYTGNGSTQTITNGIDLSTKGGLALFKIRNTTYSWQAFDTARGPTKFLNTDTSNGDQTNANSLTAFNSNGFTLGSAWTNDSGAPYASWTFRKQPKFFDVVTGTADSSGNVSFSHSLGAAPGFVIIKSTNSSNQWFCYHQSLGTSYSILLNTTGAAQNQGAGFVTSTSTTFSMNIGFGAGAVGYVAYLFAHNAGGFGASGSDNVISCGSFTTDGSGNATVTLGYEPQWILAKRSDGSSNWRMVDTMRGWPVGSDLQILYADSSLAEGTDSPFISLNATGFKTVPGNITNSSTWIYIAIRRGPMKVPTSGTSVFAPVVQASASPTLITTNFPVDMSWMRASLASANQIYDLDRLRGNSAYLETATTNAEQTYSGGWNFQSNVGVNDVAWSSSGAIWWNFRRAPGFFDVVCYTGTGVARTVAHNLGVVPELMIVKIRGTNTGNWQVYHKDVGINKGLELNGAFAAGNNTGLWVAPPTASVFSVNSFNDWNGSGQNYVAYLFASCPGVSKVGSYTGNGTNQTINCGFTGGARFVLIKRTDSTGDWYVWDTARGIVSGNDPHLSLNTTAAEVTTNDSIDTDSTGFIVNQLAATNINVSSATYIYLAIA